MTKPFSVFAAALLVLCCHAAAAQIGSGDHERTLKIDGRTRSYLVHVPPTYDKAKPTPVVLAFHGALMNARRMVSFTGLSDKADAAGFIVVYPNGVGVGDEALFFNASQPRKADGFPDDVVFTRAIVADVKGVLNVDTKRIFATGMSNGGMMTNRVAAEMADVIAAAAPVAGTLALPDIHPSRPVPVMIFHGTSDFIVPWAGPIGKTPPTMQFQSVQSTLDTWRTVNGCDQPGQVTFTPDTANDGTSVTTTTYGPGKQNAEVVLVQINGGGHTWPGVDPPVNFIGKTTHNTSANDLMWDFFQRHPMP